MRRAVRHNVQVLARLAALLILLGLGTVPVECSSVLGPHSIFVSAEAVSEVREGSHDHHHGAFHKGMGSSLVTMSVEDRGVPGAASSATDVPSTTAQGSVPAPRSVALDTLIAVAMFESDGVPALSDADVISTAVLLPASKLALAPEPPPPQISS